MPKVCNKQSVIINDIELIQSPSTMESNLLMIKNQIMDAESPFYQINLGSVYHQFIRWKTLLPRIQPFYAIKCQPDPKIIALLGKLGAGFDCASKQEIKTVIDTMEFTSSQAATNIIFANPFKFKKDIMYASRTGVNTVTFDTESELIKLSVEWPSVQLVLRVSPQRIYNATCVLGNKFGADSDEVPYLLQRAKELSMNIVGVSFHVGSGCNEMDAFPETVIYCSQIMELARKMGFNATLLDIGGGFPGLSSLNGDLDKQIQFEEMCAKLNHVIDAYFPEEDNYKIIAEPGRYFVYGAYTLTTQVIGLRSLDLTSSAANMGAIACHKEEDHYEALDNLESSSQGSIPEYLFDDLSETSEMMSANEQHCKQQQQQASQHKIIEKGFRYVINDGVYNSFNCIVFDHAKPVPFGIFDNDGYFREIAREHNLYVSTVYGPTCDGFDCLMQQEPMPKMDVGNWIVWPDMGAYTNAASSCFNGIQLADTHYFMFHEDAMNMDAFLMGRIGKNQFDDIIDSPSQLIVEVA